MNIISNNSQTGAADTASFSIDKAFKLPNMYGVGLMWNHANQWKVGLDYTLQKWGDLEYPDFDGESYTLQKELYSDRSKFNLGVQYCYGEYNRSFIKRVRYRAGVSYATPYFKVNGFEVLRKFR